MIRVLVVDDHPIVRQGLAQLINQEKDLEVCGQAEDAHEAMQAIRQLNPDMVIVDISLKDTSGMELIKDLKIQYPDLPVLSERLDLPPGTKVRTVEVAELETRPVAARAPTTEIALSPARCSSLRDAWLPFLAGLTVRNCSRSPRVVKK